MPAIAQRLTSVLPAGARTLALALTLLIPLGCAHTSDEQLRKEKAQRQEMDVMKERVRRLERKISDLDTKMTLLLERAEEGGGQASVSTGAPSYVPPAQPSYPQSAPQPAPQSYGQPSYSAAEPAGSPTSAQPIAVGPGARPIDLPGSDTPMYVDPEPSEPLVTRDERNDGPPIVIDKESLARLERNTGELPEYSRTPNRPVTRGDTRPGPAAAKRAKPRKRAAKEAPAASGRKINSPLPTGSAKKLYKWAMARRDEGNHAQAIGAFDELQKRFPKHHLADNALYWSGVCYEASGADDKALRTWKRLPMRFPKSAKIPDALFGMATLHERRGDKSTAIALYAQLVDQYPRAERARDARGALARLRGG